ncbi:hypothetical protein Cch01nite_14940 [Cellulomonas chitinilytica]|uniref:HTH cro/C1-type domain-containing protein n=1 Tax=Cellulomonas chitinilytica TaxID=398759 RepID=A0A919P163_9CELL|nr:helix-turn-helix domain-containing protein [Cellulomonas chitinilytica]GIG20770.1 hypothetical protein Cch01nite_14940 [Cellulomonas chitinilytica]
MRISSVRDLQVLVRARRRDLGITQQEAADRAGVSRKWLVNFESGTASAVELSLVLRLFAALDLPLDVPTSDEAEVDAEPVGEDWDLVDLDDHLRRLTSETRGPRPVSDR